MSVTVIQLQNEQLNEANDIKTLSKNLSSEFKEAERDFITYLDYSKYKNLEDSTIFEEMLVKNIPINVKRYLSKQNIFAYEPEWNEFGIKGSTSQKYSNNLKEEISPAFSYKDKFSHLSPRDNREDLMEEEKLILTSTK